MSALGPSPFYQGLLRLAIRVRKNVGGSFAESTAVDGGSIAGYNGSAWVQVSPAAPMLLLGGVLLLDSAQSAIVVILAAILVSFVCGSLPFAVWLQKLFRRPDPRRYGDGNPGAANAFKAGGSLAGLLVLALDISKAAAPVGLAYFNLGFRGVSMWLIALAALLGHVFSPFLGFKGGKGLAVALGVWIGLTLWRVSLPAVVLVVLWTALLDVAGWAVMLTLLGLLAVLIVWLPDPLLLAVLAGQVLLLGWTHRADLGRRPRLRAWLARRVAG